MKGTEQQPDPIVLPTQPESLLIEDIATRLNRLLKLNAKLLEDSHDTDWPAMRHFDRQAKPEMEKVYDGFKQLEQSPVARSNLFKLLALSARNVVDTINDTVAEAWGPSEGRDYR